MDPQTQSDHRCELPQVPRWISAVLGERLNPAQATKVVLALTASTALGAQLTIDSVQHPGSIIPDGR